MPTNDNHFAAGQPSGALSDPHGQAALLLTESLIHALREKGVLTLGEAIDIVETAVDVQADLAEAADGAGGAMRASHMLLFNIATSFKHDSDGSESPGL